MILPSGHITLTLLSIICLQVILPLTTWQPLGWACPDCQWRLSAHLCPMQTVHPVIWKYINYSVLAISIFCNVRLTSRSKWCQTVQRYLPGARWPLVLETFQLEKARPLAGAPRPCSPNCTLPCSFQIDISVQEFLITWFQSRGHHRPRRPSEVHREQWCRPAACGTSCSSSSRTATSSASQLPSSLPPPSLRSD